MRGVTNKGRVALPTTLAAVGVAVMVATVALDIRTAGAPIPAAAELEPGWLSALCGLAQLVPGVLLLRRLPRHPVAWVLTGFGLLWLVNGVAVSWAAYALYVSPGLPGASAGYWFYSRFGAALLLGLPLLILLFPDGRLPAFPQLTPREREILSLIAAGRANAQIASALFLSPKTVRNNVSNIFAKLHVADRAEAIVRAREAGLGRSRSGPGGDPNRQ